MTLHHRGNVSDLHDDIQDKLVRILERKGRRVYKEHIVPSISLGNSVVDVADLTDPAHPVYYEVESTGRTKRFEKKEAEFHTRLGKDIVLIDLRQLKKDVPGLEFLKVTRWLEEMIV